MFCWRFVLFSLLVCLFSPESRGGTLVQFRTTIGNFDVELYDQDKPVTVQNFIRYIQAGLYKDSIMHRDVTNFVVQGGGVYVADRGTTNQTLYYIPTFPPIANEFGVGKFYSNVYGTIAMAKTSDPNSATCQFFFNLTNNAASLDNTNNSGGFTVFGHVLAGTNMLNKFKLGPTNTVIKQLNLGGVLAECPVLHSANPANVLFTDLLYVDISLLNVQIKQLPDKSREISWTSVTGQTNRVEYTTSLPPVWQLLASTNGNGSSMKVIDTSTSNAARFYRVRVLY